MERLHSVAVLYVWIEATLQHCFESLRIAAFGRSVHHQVVLCAKLIAQIRMRLEQRACLRPIAESTRRNKTVDPREFVFRAMSQQPGRHLVIPVQRGECIRRASIGPALMDENEPNETELRAKVQEFYELSCGRIPDFIRPIVIAQHIKDGHIEREMRDFYATYRRLPVIERNPSGIGLVMEGKDEDQRPVAQKDPLEPRISEEARRFGREDKELRTALRNAFCRRKPAHLEWLAKQHGKTPEQLTESELDAYVEHGWGG
jgi:hypothetical protein